MQSDLLVWIGPAALDPPAGLGREGGRGVRRLFDAVLGDPGVALAKEPGLTAQVHGLIYLFTDPGGVQQTICTISPPFICARA